MQNKAIETFCPSSRQDWRQWLKENHDLKQSVWLVYYKKKSNISTVSYSDAVDEALCFGWIDSTLKSLDNERFMQFFCRRKPTSVWRASQECFRGLKPKLCVFRGRLKFCPIPDNS